MICDHCGDEVSRAGRRCDHCGDVYTSENDTEGCATAVPVGATPSVAVRDLQLAERPTARSPHVASSSSSSLVPFERDDREALDAFIDHARSDKAAEFLDMLGDAAVLIQAFRVQEKYGLSVMFDREALEYTASTPCGRICGTANTPAGAILIVEHKIEQGRGKLEIVSP